jgi:hypothetical protein
MRGGTLPLLAVQSLSIRRSAPHPAEPGLPLARAKRRALRSAARSAAASGGWKLCSMRCGALRLSSISVSARSLLRAASGRAGATSARAKRRALRSAARSAAASGGWKLCSMGCGALCLRAFSHFALAAPRPIRQSRSHHGASKAPRTPGRALRALCATLCCRQIRQTHAWTIPRCWSSTAA